jgi:glycosidase
MSRIARRLLVLPFLAIPLLAAEPRFESVRPSADGISYEAVLTGNASALVANGSLVFSAGGEVLPAEIEPFGEGRLRVRLKNVPPAAELLTVATSGQKGAPLTAVRLGPGTGTAFGDWVIYHVMIEMFRNGDPNNDNSVSGWKHPNYAGGDLKGILEKLDHVRSLGANAIWLSPVLLSGTSHGYDVRNYYAIADQWGAAGNRAASLELFRMLVRKAHEAGIRVILDIPLNHASKLYELPEGDPGSLKPRATGPIQPAEKLWDSWGSGYRYWNFESAPTRRFLIDAALHWIREEGVDGLRLDYVRGVPSDFWADLHAEVKKAKPGAFLVGECWADDQGPERNATEIAAYYCPVPGKGSQFDSLLDFPMQSTLTSVFARGGSAVSLEERLQADLALYGPAAGPSYFLDNHDMSRFLAWTSDPNRLVAALAFMASLSGPQVIFYGTETGLTSGAPKPGFTDSSRVPMPWGSLDEALVARVRKVFEVRRAHSSLSRGGRLPIRAEKELLVMAKRDPTETALVGVNLGKEMREVEVDLAGLVADGTTLRSALGESTFVPVPGSRKIRWRLPALSTSILAP